MFTNEAFEHIIGRSMIQILMAASDFSFLHADENW